MDKETVVGISASICTAVSLVPQLVKIIKYKRAEDVSLGMLVTLFAGLSLWVWYGIMKKDMIIMISNIFSMLINVTTVILSMKFKSREGT